MYFWTLFFKFAKNFFIILFSLVLFFVFIDFVFQRQHLPDSTNLQFLFMLYRGIFSLNIFYPLSLVFALISTVLSLIRTNELIAFLSIGYSFKKLLLPFLVFSVGISSIFIGLQFTKLAYVEDYAKAIKDNSYSLSINRNLFFKYNNSVVFIKKLNRFTKTAEGMKVFILRNQKLDKIYEIKKATFKNDSWQSNSVLVIEKGSDKITRSIEKLSILKGFKPKILDNLDKISLISLKDAFESLYLLNKESLDSSKIRIFIYSSIIIPLSFVLLVVIFFLKAPIHSRISNTFLYSVTVIFISMIVWGLFLILKKMAYNGTLNPELVFFTPFLILLTFSIHYLRKI